MIIARGTNSKCVPVPATSREVTVFDLRGMDQIVRFEKADYYIACQAGVHLAKLHGLLSANQLQFPFLRSDAVGTVGGMVSSGQIGTQQGHYDVTRWVLALQILTSSGEVIKTGAVTYKSVAGYDLPKIFCRSFGTLGLVLSATLRLYPIDAQPFGKNMSPVQHRQPLLADGSPKTNEGNCSEGIAQSIKRALDPIGLFPSIAGWNA